jgi:hypothetical protein
MRVEAQRNELRLTFPILGFLSEPRQQRDDRPVARRVDESQGR